MSTSYSTTSFYIRKNPTVSYILDPGKAQGTISLITGAFLHADFNGTFNSTILNQMEAGSTTMQRLDAVLKYRTQADQDQMANALRDVRFLKL